MFPQGKHLHMRQQKHEYFIIQDVPKKGYSSFEYIVFIFPAFLSQSLQIGYCSCLFIHSVGIHLNFHMVWDWEGNEIMVGWVVIHSYVLEP